MSFASPTFSSVIAVLPLKAESADRFFSVSSLSYTAWLTNSILVSVLVVGLILLFARQSTIRLRMVPGGMQNLFEALVEITYEGIEGIVGSHVAKKAFGFLASLFLFILFSNWFSLLPGVGAIGWGPRIAPLTLSEVEVPLLRPTTADLNMTLGLAVISMCFWFFWTIQEVGFSGFLKDLFGVKGGVKGMVLVILTPLFLFVGVLEVVSILIRPVSLSLRLYGNVYAGESLLHTMINLGHTLHMPEWLAMLMGVLIPTPFYFLELLIGFLQAMVFMLLVAVYLQLSTVHAE